MALSGLSHVGVRTHDRVMSLVIKLLSKDRSDPEQLENIHRALATHRNIMPNEFREKNMLLLRQLKSAYIAQYGYDDAVNKCMSIEQLQVIVPVNTYTALMRAIEVKKQLQKQAQNCDHAGRYTPALLLDQFLDLSNRDNV